MTDTTSNPRPAVPDIGQPFLHNGQPLAVRGWARRTTQPGPPAGPDHRPLVHCLRDRAHYVITSGLPGHILRITDINPDPHPIWQHSTIQAARTMAEHLNHQPIHPHHPKGQPMSFRRGTPDITFVDNGTALKISYRVTTEHTATVPIDELPVELDDLYAEHDIDPDGDDAAKIEAVAEQIESDLEGLLDQHTDFERPDGITYELAFTKPTT